MTLSVFPGDTAEDPDVRAVHQLHRVSAGGRPLLRLVLSREKVTPSLTQSHLVICLPKPV